MSTLSKKILDSFNVHTSRKNFAYDRWGESLQLYNECSEEVVNAPVPIKKIYTMYATIYSRHMINIDVATNAHLEKLKEKSFVYIMRWLTGDSLAMAKQLSYLIQHRDREEALVLANQLIDELTFKY
ncbi:MAG: hypothetical protein GY941_21010 [Planctomycetes bacterium]|nr:hypothetical protein [Planctomycetota bacterium]